MPETRTARFPLFSLFVGRGRWNLRKRFFTYMILLIVLLMGGVFAVIEKNNRGVILLEGQKRGLSNALYLAALSTAPLLMYDYTKLEQNVDVVAKEPDVVYAMILDRQENVIAHSSRDDLLGKPLNDSISRAAAASTTQLIQDYRDPSSGVEMWDIAYPIFQGAGNKWGTVRIGFSKRFLKDEIAGNRRDLVILALVAVLLAGGAATLLAERITDPIRKLAEAVHSITRGDLGREITIRTRDEIEDLSRTFNSMTRELAKNREKQKKLIRQLSRKNKQLKGEIVAREQLEGELIKMERLRALGEMSGGVAHDFNNILGAILGRAQLLLERIDDAHVKKGLEIIEKAALDGAETVRRIQEFTRVRADANTFSEVDINQVIEDALEFTRTRWKNEAEAKGIGVEVHCDFGDIPALSGDPAGLREVFTNLIVNAVDAMPKGGDITISTIKEEESVLITLADTGMGMSAEIQKRIFDPFFTTKGTHGSGLGLSICYGIVSRHRGEISVSSRIGEGSTFIIRLPLGRAAKTKAEPLEAGSDLLSARILVIDDDEVFRSVLADTLLESGCHVDQAGSGSEGLSLFAEGEYDLVITDLGMEHMSGWDVAQKVKERAAGTPVALISGWGSQIDETTARAKGVDFIVAKPFRLDQLRGIVRNAVAAKSGS
jgi:signal transduction histidine kinase